jgi:hypothetical protein
MTRNGNGTPPAEEAVLVDPADAPVESFEDAPEEAPAEAAELVELRTRPGYNFDASVEGVPEIKDGVSMFLEPELAAQVLNKDKSRVYVYVVENTASEEKE